MTENNINSHVFEEEPSGLDLDIRTEISFSKKDHPEGKMIPITIDGKEEFILIPLNIKNGETIKITGRGKYHPRSGKTGDLYVLIHIEEKVIPWKKILIPVSVAAIAIVGCFLILKKPKATPAPTIETSTAPCEHAWKPEDCTTPKTCELCGETSGSALGHQWIEATYDSPKTCSSCGATEGQALPKPTVQKNDVVAFGSYEQDGLRNNGAEPIEWIVLDVQDDRALLLSRYALDSKPYNDTYGPVNWEKCTLRSWLNSTFLDTAFAEDEKQIILTTEVDNSREQGNREWNTNGGSNTEDTVFLLSYAETDLYFDSAFDRMCLPTNYAISRGADTRILDDGITESGWWWLRSPGEAEHQASFVNFDGTRYTNGVGNGYLSVRPALWVKLDGTLFS